MINQKLWDNHYRKNKSILAYPDENLVRMLSRETGETDTASLAAIDIGCGSGRHVSLLNDFGFGSVTATDMSENSVSITAKNYRCMPIQCFNDRMPFRNGVFDIAVAWGSLHYADKPNAKLQVAEILRILRLGGTLFGTLRSCHDTCLRKGRNTGNNTWITELEDLREVTVSFFDSSELELLFEHFGSLEYGIMERTQPGKPGERISHWYYRAVK